MLKAPSVRKSGANSNRSGSVAQFFFKGVGILILGGSLALKPSLAASANGGSGPPDLRNDDRNDVRNPQPSFYRKQEIALIEELIRTQIDSGGPDTRDRHDWGDEPREQLFEKLSSELAQMRRARGLGGAGPRRHEAVYLDALLMAKFTTIYDLLFDSEKAKAFQSEVVGVKLSTLFDGFMELVAAGQVPEGMKSAAEDVGECVANVIIRARPTCELDDQTTHEPSAAKLAWIRLTCGALTSDCGVRRDFFAAAKPALEKARNDPQVQEQIRKKFEEVFPERFRQGMLQELSKMRATYGEWVAEKFLPPSVKRAQVGPLSLILERDAPLFVADQESPEHGLTHRLDGIAHGLRADLALARMGRRVMQAREKSNNPEVVGRISSETAAAFWSSIQQLLVLTGGARAKYSRIESQYRLIEGGLKQLPPRFSRESPYLRGALFGGWGALAHDSSLVYQPWDWEKYAQLPAEKGSPIQILPHQLALDFAGRPRAIGPESAEQHLGDHAALLEAIADFLEMTGAGGEFSSFLGPQKDLAAISDPSQTILLPVESRLLGYAILAGVFRNLTHPDYALIEKQEKILPGEGLGVKFFESSSLLSVKALPAGSSSDSSASQAAPEASPLITPMIRPQAHTSSLARMILACARLRARVLEDAQFPGQDRKASVDQLDTLIQVGALSLIAQAQNGDGGFRKTLNTPGQVSDLMSSAMALRAIQTAYLISEMKIFTINLKSGMTWMKSNLPSLEGLDNGNATVLAPAERVALWHFLLLWERAKPDWSEAIFFPGGPGSPSNPSDPIHPIKKDRWRKLQNTLLWSLR